MEMYAQRKGWDVGGVEVTCDYTPAERGCPTRFNLVMRFPDGAERGAGRAPARHRRQVPGPPHARRRGHVRRACRARHARALRLAHRAARRPPRPRGGGGARRARPHRRRRARAAVRRRTATCTPSSPAAATTCAATPARSRSPAGARTTTRRTCAGPRCARPRRRSGCRRRRRADRRAPADADDRHELRRLSVRRADRARARMARRRRPRSPRCSSSRSTRCAPGTRGAGCCAAASRSAPTSTASASTSSGARRRGSSRTCSSGSPRICSGDGRTRRPGPPRSGCRPGQALSACPATVETYVATASICASRQLALEGRHRAAAVVDLADDRGLRRLELVEVRPDGAGRARVLQRVAALAVLGEDRLALGRGVLGAPAAVLVDVSLRPGGRRAAGEPPPLSSPPQAASPRASAARTAHSRSLNMARTLPRDPAAESHRLSAPDIPVRRGAVRRDRNGEGRPAGRPSRHDARPQPPYATSFSIGTLTRLPHSVHEPS